MHIHSCGGNKFEVVIKRNGIIELGDVNGVTTPNVVEESETFEFDFVKCVACGEAIVDVATEVIEAIECTECHIYVPKDSVDLDGKCNDCNMPPRPDLENLSQKDYIRKILELEKLLAKKGDSLIDMPDMEV